MRLPRAVLFAIILVAATMGGCVQNMPELKEKLGFASLPAAAPVYQPPLARAQVNASTSIAGMPLHFTSEGSKDPQGLPLEFRWSFGDVPSVTGAEVTHAFAKAGEYRVRLDVINAAGLSDGASLIVKVLASDRRPVAAFSVTDDAGSSVASAQTGTKLVFDATASTDADGDALTYVWDFGDGSTSFAATATHAFAAPGQYTIKLKVADPAGLSHEATLALPIGSTLKESGKFDPLTSQARSLPLTVGDGAKRLNATLTFPAGVAAQNELTLILKDASGREVARTTAPAMPVPPPGPTDAVTRALMLDAEVLARQVSGAWTILIEPTSAPAGAEWALVLSQAY